MFANLLLDHLKVGSTNDKVSIEDILAPSLTNGVTTLYCPGRRYNANHQSFDLECLLRNYKVRIPV